MDLYFKPGDWVENRRGGRRGRPLLLRALGFAALLAVGFWIRSLLPAKAVPAVSGRWPWATKTMVTLYFSSGPFLFPVSRRMPSDDGLPRAAMQALLDGPREGSGLRSPVPQGAEILSFGLADGVVHVDLSAAVLRGNGDTQPMETAIVETLTALPGVTGVSVSVEGKPLLRSAHRTPLLYYASANGLVAVPASATNPRNALGSYLTGPPDAQLTGLPADVRLLSYNYDAGDSMLSLNFSYTPSLHALALDKPTRMRTVLLGLIAGLTEFPEVRAVYLDFEGHSRLGLGECSDLLQTPQARPALLNDERLLGS